MRWFLRLYLLWCNKVIRFHPQKFLKEMYEPRSRSRGKWGERVSSSYWELGSVDLGTKESVTRDWVPLYPYSLYPYYYKLYKDEVLNLYYYLYQALIGFKTEGSIDCKGISYVEVKFYFSTFATSVITFTLIRWVTHFNITLTTLHTHKYYLLSIKKRWKKFFLRLIEPPTTKEQKGISSHNPHNHRNR